MGNERDDEQFGENQGSPEQGRKDETGKDKEQPGGFGSEPTASGQSDTAGQGSTGQEASGQTQPSGGTDTMSDARNAEGGSGATEPTGEGFVGSQGTDSGEYLQEKGKKDDSNIEGTPDEPPLDGE